MRRQIVSQIIRVTIGLTFVLLACGHKVDSPSIDSVSPSRGQPGSPVVITGEKLSDQYSQTKVLIAGKEVNSREFFDIREDRVRFRIPGDVFSGELRIEVADKKTNPVPFEVVGSWLYVLHEGSTRITAIDTHAQRVEETIELPFVPTNIVFSYDGRYAYAIHKDNDLISVIRCFDNQVIASIPVASKPHAGANVANLDTPYVFILHEGSNSVTAINTERNEVAAVFPLECPPSVIAVTSNGEKACVACREERKLYIIKVEDLEIDESTSLTYRPGKMEIGPDDGSLIILNDADNTLTVVSLNRISRQNSVTFESPPVDFAVSLPREYACVIHQNNTASIVRLGGPEVVAIREVGIEPVAVEVEPFGRYAFIANRQSNNLSVLDLREWTIMMTIGLESPPLALTSMKTALRNVLYLANEQAPWMSVVSFGQYEVDKDEEPDPSFFAFLASIETDANPRVMETQVIHRKPAAEEGFPESGIP